MIETSEQINEIAGALAKAQTEMENVAKDRENPHFRAKYATLAGVLDEVRPKLAKQGIMIHQATVNGEGSSVGVVTLLAHNSGQWIRSSFYVLPTKPDAQGAGSALTYARRYSLMAAAGVAPEDDDGEAAIARPQGSPQRAGIVRADDVPRAGPPQPRAAIEPAKLQAVDTESIEDRKARAMKIKDAVKLSLQNAQTRAARDDILVLNNSDLEWLQNNFRSTYDKLMEFAAGLENYGAAG